MSNQQIVNELKDKKLPVYGTNQEKRDRLKGFHKIPVDKGGAKKNSTRSAIAQLAENREERRRKMEEIKEQRSAMEAANKA
jgi:hypothetical protein